MTEPYIGEIQLFGFNFAPYQWAFCNGATLPIQQNTALFSLLGIAYGGNGQTTFQLPNFAGRAGCQQGSGPGLSPRSRGQAFGADTITLTGNQIPQHNHTINAFAPATVGSPAPNGALSQPGVAANRPFVSSAPNTTFAPNMLSANGGGQPHPNQQPYLGMNFSIALHGVFPSFT